MHSFRGGCSITLSLLSVPSEDVTGHVGWSSLVKADYYSQTGKVMNSDSVAASLAMSTAPSPTEREPLAAVVTQASSEKNDTRNLSLAILIHVHAAEFQNTRVTFPFLWKVRCMIKG